MTVSIKIGQRAVPASFFGNALFVVWNFYTFGYEASGAFAWFSIPITNNATWLLFSVISVLMCCVALVFQKPLTALLARPWLCISAALLVPIGVVLLMLRIPILAIAGICLAAFGNVVLYLAWAKVYAHLDLDDMGIVVLGSIALSSICAFALIWLPGPIRLVCAQIIPPFSMLLALWSQGALYDTDTNGDDPASAAVTTKSPAMEFQPFHIAKYAAAVAGLFSVLFFLFPFVTMGSEGIAYLLSPFVIAAGFLLGVLVALVLFRFARSMDMFNISAWIMPLLAFVAVLLVFGTQVTVASIFLVAIMVILPPLLLVCMSKLYHQGLGSFILVFLGGNVAMQAGAAAGSLCADLAIHITDASQGYSGAVLLLLLFVVVLGSITRNSRPDLLPKQEGPQDTHANAVQELAQRYNLSNRETEVLALLVKGRSSTYICDELYISQNTVSTHIKRIYQKTGAHSKQEVINLYEDSTKP
jgi:DNA-binding CsgD family transcriptional regulator